ncbi:STAS domain-containing protein [Alteromonas sp. ZYF713]|nr:STAS domain-containing protein [Alteromonas sp. ZYF713]
MAEDSTVSSINSPSCTVLGNGSGKCFIVSQDLGGELVYCNKCLVGQLAGENCLMLPAVLLGKNAQQVFSALKFVNFNDYHNSFFNIDFARVQKVDSGGIGALILLRKKVIPRSVEICLINIKPEIYRTFSMCKLNKIFMLKQ